VPLLPLAMVRKVPTTLMMMSRSHLETLDSKIQNEKNDRRCTEYAREESVRAVRTIGCKIGWLCLNLKSSRNV